MSWIADIVYDLKMTDGQPFFFNHDEFSFDVRTGLKAKNTMTSTSFYVSKTIPLPLNVRQAFFKTINLTKEAYLQPGEAQFILDASDIPANLSVKINDYILDSDNTRYDISGLEKIQNDAYLLTVKVV